MTYSTVQMRVQGTYTEPPGSYGNPVGSVTTTVSDTKAFDFSLWVIAGTEAAQAATATAFVNELTKDMRQLGQIFSAYTVTATGVTRAYAPPTPT